MSIIDELYYTKNAILMIENEEDSDYDNSAIKIFNELNIKDNYDSIESLKEFVVEYKNKLIEVLGNKFDEYLNEEMSVYSDKFHHRSFFNEIPNQKPISEIVDRLDELVSTGNKYEVIVYDLNDYRFTFDTVDEALFFVSDNNIDPCIIYDIENDCEV